MSQFAAAAAAVVWWEQPIKFVQEVPVSAAFVPHHAHFLSSKTHNDEQGSDKRKLMSLTLFLSDISLAVGTGRGHVLQMMTGKQSRQSDL